MELHFISNQREERITSVDSFSDGTLFDGTISPSIGTELLDWTMEVDLEQQDLGGKPNIETDSDNRVETVTATRISSAPSLGNENEIHDKLKLSSSEWAILLKELDGVDIGNKKLQEEKTKSKSVVRLTKAYKEELRNVVLLTKYGESRLDVFKRASEAFERSGLSKISFNAFTKHLRRLEKGENVSRRRSFQKYTPLHYEMLKRFVLHTGRSSAYRTSYNLFLEQLEDAGGLIPMKYRTFIDLVAKIRRS